MYIYLLIKVILEVVGYKWKLWLQYFFIFFEFFVISLYFYLVYINQISGFFYSLFYWCLFWIFFIFVYKMLRQCLIKNEEIIKWIESKEKIKKILLNSKVNKIIYYFVWSLPWNIGYWTYFWIMENGWYLRVWFCSNRDIFFMKYLGWDSRDFFFKMNKILFENIFISFIFILYYWLIMNIIRFLFIILFFRKNLLSINLIMYIINRIFIFCYLSMFYVFFIYEVYIINSFFLIFIIFLEFLIFCFFDIFIYILLKSRYSFILKAVDSKYLMFLIDPLGTNFNIVTSLFFEVNNQVWNVILGESVSLNILKQYMLWVNKNKKGYYFYEMNILPKYNIVKLFEISSIPFDILPRTRYVIMNLRSINNNFFKDQIILKNSGFVMPDYRIRKMKNLYLSYFEKTYAVDSSILSIIFLLRMNFPVNYVYLQEIYKNFIKNKCGLVINYIMMYQKSALWRLRLAEINKANPELFNICYLLNSFKIENQLYDIEYFFMIDFFRNEIGKKKPKIEFNRSIKEYKENMKLLAHFMLYEEEGIIWNLNVVNCLNLIEQTLNNERLLYNKFFFSFFQKNEDLEVYINILNEKEVYDEIVYKILKFYKFEFNDDVNLHDILKLDFKEIKNLNLRVVNLGFLNENNVIREYCLALIYDIELLSLENIDKSRYSFLFKKN